MRITLPTLPTTEQAFSALTQNGTAVPEQVCAYLLCALHLYTLDPEAGIAAMNQLRGPRPMTPYDGQFLRDRLRGKAYLPQSYFHGASPANNYTPAQPYVLEVLPDPRPQDVEAGYLRFYLKSGGADSPRPLKLRQKGDQWFLWEYSSILSGVRIPAAEDPWM